MVELLVVDAVKPIGSLGWFETAGGHRSQIEQAGRGLWVEHYGIRPVRKQTSGGAHRAERLRSKNPADDEQQGREKEGVVYRQRGMGK